METIKSYLVPGKQVDDEQMYDTGRQATKSDMIGEGTHVEHADNVSGDRAGAQQSYPTSQESHRAAVDTHGGPYSSGSATRSYSSTKHHIPGDYPETPASESHNPYTSQPVDSRVGVHDSHTHETNAAYEPSTTAANTNVHESTTQSYPAPTNASSGQHLYVPPTTATADIPERDASCTVPNQDTKGLNTARTQDYSIDSDPNYRGAYSDANMEAVRHTPSGGGGFSADRAHNTEPSVKYTGSGTQDHPTNGVNNEKDHHRGRNAALGAGVLGAGAYAYDSHDKEHTVQPSHQSTGGIDNYPTTTGRHGADTTQAVDSRQRFHGKDQTLAGAGGIASTGISDHRAHGTEPSAEYTGSGTQDHLTEDVNNEKDHHYGRNAAIGAGVLGAGAYVYDKHDKEPTMQPSHQFTSGMDHHPTATGKHGADTTQAVDSKQRFYSEEQTLAGAGGIASTGISGHGPTQRGTHDKPYTEGAPISDKFERTGASGPAPNTSGPHEHDILNRTDQTVDPNYSAVATTGSEATHGRQVQSDVHNDGYHADGDRKAKAGAGMIVGQKEAETKYTEDTHGLGSSLYTTDPQTGQKMYNAEVPRGNDYGKEVDDPRYGLPMAAAGVTAGEAEGLRNHDEDLMAKQQEKEKKKKGGLFGGILHRNKEEKTVEDKPKRTLSKKERKAEPKTEPRMHEHHHEKTAAATAGTAAAVGTTYGVHEHYEQDPAELESAQKYPQTSHAHTRGGDDQIPEEQFRNMSMKDEARYPGQQADMASQPAFSGGMVDANGRPLSSGSSSKRLGDGGVTGATVVPAANAYDSDGSRRLKDDGTTGAPRSPTGSSGSVGAGYGVENAHLGRHNISVAERDGRKLLHKNPPKNHPAAQTLGQNTQPYN